MYQVNWGYWKAIFFSQDWYYTSIEIWEECRKGPTWSKNFLIKIIFGWSYHLYKSRKAIQNWINSGWTLHKILFYYLLTWSLLALLLKRLINTASRGSIKNLNNWVSIKHRLFCTSKRACRPLCIFITLWHARVAPTFLNMALVPFN